MKLGLDTTPWWGQLALYALLSVGAVVGYYYFFHVDLEADLARQTQALQALQAEVARGQAEERRLPEFRAEVTDLESRLGALKAVLPEQKDVGELLRRIQTLAVQSSLTIRAFKPQAVAVKQLHAEWPIVLQIEGRFHDLGVFFDRVSRLPRIINITRIDIKAHDAGNAVESGASISADLTVTTFVLSEPVPGAAAPRGRTARAGRAGGAR